MRAAVGGVVSLAALSAFAGAQSCSSNAAAPAPACGRYGAYGPKGDALSGKRQACCFDAGSKARDTVADAGSAPLPIEHVVVLMFENRSFDHLLSTLPGLADPVDPMKSNPDGDGGVMTRYHETQTCIGGPTDPPHEWSDAHLAYGGGTMDGFVQSGGCATMAYYTESELPVLNSLAKQFAVSDRYFASLLGPTQPNRLFLYAATSCGFGEGNDSNLDVIFKCGASHPNILGLLGSDYGVYEETPASVLVSLLVYKGIPSSIEDFEEAVRTNRLPKVAFVGASTGGAPAPPFAPEDDDHPPSDVRAGDAFLRRIVSAIASNQSVWRSTVLFITFDEYGGFYDHVVPPHACDPETRPSGACGEVLEPPSRDIDASDDPGTHFDQYGFRVPLVAISPFARRSMVAHTDADHTSILRFIEYWLDLPALTLRDANAWPLLDMFDFGHPNYDPPALPDPVTFTPCSGQKPSCVR